jgi:hypothetical protein
MQITRIELGRGAPRDGVFDTTAIEADLGFVPERSVVAAAEAVGKL